MALKDWKRSKTPIRGQIHYYKPGGVGRGGTDVARETLTAVPFGTDYDIYHNNRKIKRVESKSKALKFMKSFMRKN